MSARLQLIEQKLLAINAAAFQSLCDTYLFLKEKEYSSLSRIGSQLGKQKTIKGTPDTFMRIAGGKLRYVEFTTQAYGLVSKIKEDIDKCLDESKTKVDPKNIYEIVICFNNRLKPDEEIDVYKYGEEKNIKLYLVGIDTLALEILSKHLFLAKEFLNIPLDTGQILPLSAFIEEYNHKAKQLSTPLDNTFLHRNEELVKISKNLSIKDLLVISGPPGIGKTKLGLQAIQDFIKQNPSYNSFVIAKKDVDIFEDLKIQLHAENNYILLIDDANRQLPNLAQIIGFFKEKKQGNLKIVLTVRNYALSDIEKLILEFYYEVICIEPFKDKEITDILESDYIKIKNSQYQKKIVEIANGNPRLAIMGAKLALEKQMSFLLEDVSDLLETYFKNFAIDFDLFENQNLLNALGLVSFFYTINREDKEFLRKLLLNFKIDYYVFNEAVQELHKRELVEIKYGHIRISEQVMATYFFYIVFIKNKLLSFKTLLFTYFPAHKSLFKEAIIPANNTIGYDNVFSNINSDIDEYIRQNKGNDSKILEFLDLFWFYKPEETLSIFIEKINSIAEPNNPIYHTHYETNDFVYDREQTIDFISRFFWNDTESFTPAIELGFEYIRKKPEHLPEFIRRIRENLLFDQPDELNAYKRQSKLIELVTNQVKKNTEHYTIAFFAIAKTFLKHSFQITHGGRKHTLTFYNYPIPNTPQIRELRRSIWQTLFYCFDEHTDKVIGVIKNYKLDYHKRNYEIVDHDLGLLIPFIESNFSPTSFKETCAVHKLISSLEKTKEIKNLSYKELKPIFDTQEYRDYRKLEWNFLKDKEVYDFDDWREYEQLKIEDLKRNFSYTSEEDFQTFFKTIENFLSIKDDRSSITNSIDVIVAENFKENENIGFLLLQNYLKKGYEIDFLKKTIYLICNSSSEWAFGLWEELKTLEGKRTLEWKLHFFRCLPENYIDKHYYNELIHTIQKIENFVYLHIEDFSRFSIINKKVLKEIFLIVMEKNNSHSCKIRIWDYPFSEAIYIFDNDYELMKEVYFQQFELNDFVTFDYYRKGFKNIYDIYPQFLLEFTKKFLWSYSYSREYASLKFGFIWDYANGVLNIEDVFEYLIKSDSYMDDDGYPASIFFNELDETQKNVASTFARKYIFKNHFNEKKVQFIFNIIRVHLNNEFEGLLLFYLKLNTDLEAFKKIDWNGNAGVQIGEVIWGNLYAVRWKKILDIVNKSNQTLEIIPIKNFLKKNIQSCYEDAEVERKQKFIKPERY